MYQNTKLPPDKATLRYNCMVLDLVLTDHGLAQPYLTSSAITDEECGVEFCQENLTNPDQALTAANIKF